HLGEQPPTLVVHRAALDTALLHLRHERLDVIAHQIELVHIILFPRMHRDLGRRKAEDQPSSPHVDARQLQDIEQKLAVGIGILAVDDRVSADDHDLTSQATRSSLPEFISPYSPRSSKKTRKSVAGAP